MRINFLTIAIFCTFVFCTKSPGAELKTEYQNSYPKYYISSSSGKTRVNGLCIDIIKAVEKELTEIKITAKKEFVPFKRIQGNLEEGKIDVFFGFAKNSKRLEKYKFIDIPIYEVNHVIAVKADDNINIKTLEDTGKLKGNKTILTNFGTATEKFLKEKENLTIDAGGKTLSVNLEKLLLGRGRMVYFHDLGLYGTVKRNFNSGKIKILPVSFRKYFHYIAFSKKVPTEVIDKVKDAVKKLKDNGTLEKIRGSYIEK
jgi:ABC-type amino acid transport substrate-binding protein